jgi:hypothetical protein
MDGVGLGWIADGNGHRRLDQAVTGVIGRGADVSLNEVRDRGKINPLQIIEELGPLAIRKLGPEVQEVSLPRRVTPLSGQFKSSID